MQTQTQHRFPHSKTLRLLAAAFLFTFFHGGAIEAASGSGSEVVTVDSRGSSHHRAGGHYDRSGKSRHGHHGDRHYRSGKRSGHHRYDGHHRYRFDHRSKYDHRGRYDRHYRSPYYRYDRGHRYDRYNGSRYGSHYGSHHYRSRHFEVPRRILHDLVHAYRDYHYGRHYYASHNHYHEVYRFPVYYEAGVKYLPYAYCEGAYFATGIFSHDGPHFDHHRRY